MEFLRYFYKRVGILRMLGACGILMQTGKSFNAIGCGNYPLLKVPYNDNVPTQN